MKYFQAVLDKHTMYQTVVTVLSLLVLGAFMFSVVGVIQYSLSALLLSFFVIMGVSLGTHYFFVWYKNAPANIWSSVITALILFLIFTPSVELEKLFALGMISFIAILSKYYIQYRHMHILNPVVLAAVIGGFTGFAYASWWIGSTVMFPIVLIGGLAVVLKMRRFGMVVAGILASLVMVYIQALLTDNVSLSTFSMLLFSSPLIFYMMIMVTEPLTTPAGTKAQVLYGIFIGLLSNIPFTIGFIYNSPEFTLFIANLLVYLLSLRGRVKMVCKAITEIADNTFEFSFTPSQKINFKPGQYLEWALPHDNPDKRGTRRYFTIASSPTEQSVKMAVRMVEKNGSSYKKALTNLSEGGVLNATQMSGGFVLPKNVQQKSYVFIAGGIGVTPFRSQLKYLLDTKQKIDAHLFYFNNFIEDIAYEDLMLEAQNELGISVTYVLNNPPDGWVGESGYLTKKMLIKYIPDIAQKVFYISGPPSMVGSYKVLLRSMGVPARSIHTDYFPGLA